MAKYARLTGIAPWFLIGIGVMGLAVSGVLLWGRPASPGPRHQSATAPTVEIAPSAAKPPATEIKKYTVPAVHPKYISIPSIQVSDARIIPLGLKPDNAIANPDNLFDAGWYKASAKPGEQGAMFIYGHLSNWEARGLFYDLKKLQKDDVVTITNGAGKQFTYRVETIRTYPYDAVDMNAALAPIGNKPGLNLMTCSGKVIEGTSDFSERLVVFTSLVTD